MSLVLPLNEFLVAVPCAVELGVAFSFRRPDPVRPLRPRPRPPVLLRVLLPRPAVTVPSLPVEEAAVVAAETVCSAVDMVFGCLPRPVVSRSKDGVGRLCLVLVVRQA